MFGFMGDLHLRLRAWESIPFLQGDSYRALDQIVAECIKRRVTALVLGGDNLDVNHPDPDAVGKLVAAFELLVKNNIKIYFIQGQHCRGKIMPWPCIMPTWSTWIHDKIVEVEPCLHMAGFDNMSAEELKLKLQTLDPKVDILVVHQLAKGACGEGVWDFDPEWVPPTVKLVLMGDYHKGWEKTLERELNGVKYKTHFCYSGSSCMQTVDEPPNKHFLIVNTPALSVEKVPLQSRPFFEFMITTEAQAIDALIKLKELPPAALVVVRYDARVEQLEQRFKEARNDLFFMWKILPLELVQSPEEVEELLSGEVSLRSCLAKVVDPKTEENFYSFVLTLLNSTDPKETLKVEKEKFFAAETKEEEPCVSKQ